MIDITGARFFGSKAATVTATRVAAQEPVGEYTWQLIDVTTDRGTETYQVLVDGDTDVLHTDAGATAYVANVGTLGEVHGELRPAPATPMGAEQSNTSLYVGDTIVKVFRRLEDGLNPDVELLSRIDNPHVAPVTAYVVRGGQTLAMQQARLTGTDGFDAATQGELSLADARDLGAAIRSVHDSLADTFGTGTVSADEIKQELHGRLDQNIARAAVLDEHAHLIRAAIDRIPDEPVAVQRVHGDLHLGQTIKSDTWYLIDFEGEPARSLSERRRPDHPLRDVAGMVRSFGYAAAVGKHGPEWGDEMAAALLEGYGDADEVLLAAYVADKAAYEVAYEANNRPDWIDIPLRAIEALS